jgi:hypothetical protein
MSAVLMAVLLALAARCSAGSQYWSPQKHGSPVKQALIKITP